MRLQRPHVPKCPRKTPRNRSHRRNSGGTTHGSAARTPRVARCPTKTSRNRSESGIVSPQTHGAAGRTTAHAVGTSDRVKRSEVAFSAPPGGPKTCSAPQENLPRAKNGPRHASRKRIEHFSFRHKNFSQTFRGHVLPTKDATAQTQKPQKRSVSRFRNQGRKRPTPRNRRTGRADTEPQFPKKRFFVPICPMNTTEKGAKTKLFGNFSDVKKNDETPIFVAFWKFRFASGSVSTLRGLRISP